ncbi:MAG: hypothetical protein ABI977_10355 [Acidobacteriota bacterium]
MTSPAGNFLLHHSTRNLPLPQPENGIAIAESLRSPATDPFIPDESWRRPVQPVQQKRALIEGESQHKSPQGLRLQTDLLPIFKSRGYISEVLSGKRAISKRIAKALGERFPVSAELFI